MSEKVPPQQLAAPPGAHGLFARGSATVDEILQLSYGHWPPVGLNIIGSNDQLVQISDMPAHRQGSGILAYGNVGGQRAMELNRAALAQGVSGRDLLPTAMAHENAHIVQRDHAERREQTFGYIPGLPKARKLESDTITGPLWAQHAIPEQVAALGDAPQNLISGREIQARLAQVIPDGYQQWGVMPQNREQLLIALEGLGLTAPASISGPLRASPSYEANRQVFSSRPETSPKVVGHLNLAIGTLTPEGQHAFWDQAMPALYADLIEMYGDREGRSRFGLGDNPKLALRRNREELTQLVCKANWVDGVDDAGAPAKLLDHSNMPAAAQSRIRDGLGLLQINVYSDANAWPPIDNPRPVLIVSGNDLQRLQALQIAHQEPLGVTEAFTAGAHKVAAKVLPRQPAPPSAKPG